MKTSKTYSQIIHNLGTPRHVRNAGCGGSKSDQVLEETLVQCVVEIGAVGLAAALLVPGLATSLDQFDSFIPFRL